MGDRFYAQRDGKMGYSKSKIHDTKSAADKPKRRLKADIVKHIVDLLGCSGLPSMDKMTIADLEVLEDILKQRK